MYATIIVIIVNDKSSMEETYGISALIASGENPVRDIEERPATVGHLSFAVPPSTTGSADTERLGGPTDGDDVDSFRGEKTRVMTGKDDGVGSKAEPAHVWKKYWIRSHFSSAYDPV